MHVYLQVLICTAGTHVPSRFLIILPVVLYRLGLAGHYSFLQVSRGIEVVPMDWHVNWRYPVHYVLILAAPNVPSQLATGRRVTRYL